ncbi:hypothetical protein COU75_00995 [Candidatus Peregrinibacteria bacterium CG10_big_fil_rev_8_21_14_0_10_42_8]|nr:MAG: hypothetical protein COU75_00995 [Candidatus Peregrinibacteria bacterium CG10_big_fil_rev_8_21_14_0_10_42_8]
MYKQKHIHDLVAQLYFLPWEESQKIINGAKNATNEAIDSLVVVLKDALKKQEEMVQKMIAADPEFPKKLDTFIRSQLNDAAVSVEKQDQKKASQQFEDFD